MKTRSSSGVGMKVDLAFNVDTLRIEDLGEDDQDQGSASNTSSSSSIVDALKRNNASSSSSSSEDPDDGAPVAKVTAKTDSTKLRDFLNNLD